MYSLNRFVACLGLCALLFPGLSVAKDVSLDTEEQQTIYAIGLILANMVDQQMAGFEFSPEERAIVLAGVMDSLEQKPPRVDLQTLAPKVNTYAKTRMEKIQLAKMTPEDRKAYEERKVLAARTMEEEKTNAKAFLDQLATEKGAVRKPSGLIYRETVAGKGASPTESSVVKVHYTGKLRDGTEFDSSVARGEPAEFPLNRVIPCWTEALQLMKPGGKAQIGCPADLAYGTSGRPGVIPPEAALSFEVELLEVVPEAKETK